MRLENSFEVPAGPDRTWEILLDVPGIAGCVPGARLTEVVDERTFKGEATVKIGPVSLTFAGEAKIVEADDQAHRAKVQARGADKRGRGNANADVVFVLSPQDGQGTGTRVEVVTTLHLAGAVAQYGRGTGLIEAIADEIIGDFARNLEARIRSGDAADPRITAASAAPEAPASRQTQPGDAAAARDASQASETSLSGLGLIWRALVTLLRKALGRPVRRR